MNRAAPLIMIAACIGYVAYAAGENVKLADKVEVIDGDTIKLTVRLSGIDAPELDGACEQERDMAVSAKNALAELLTSGIQHEDVSIEIDGIDRYGRALALIKADGMNVGDSLITRGLAHEWKGSREKSGSWCE